ncbi:hypothetical protein [Streptomyces sp. STD57]|uniref:hypothetical protein n=1 Tax=Streptomyces sp. STD57 TaxID=3231528 RepID=UPI00345C0D98
MPRTEFYDDPAAPEPNSLVVAASAVVTDDAGRILMQRGVGQPRAGRTAGCGRCPGYGVAMGRHGARRRVPRRPQPYLG